MPRRKNARSDTESAYQVGVAVGHAVTWLETFSQNTGVPYEVLSARVAAALSPAREGVSNHLSSLPSESAGPLQRVPKVAVAKQPRGRKARKLPRAKGGRRKGPVSYWAKMSAEERRQEMRRRLGVRIKNRLKLAA